MRAFRWKLVVMAMVTATSFGAAACLSGSSRSPATSTFSAGRQAALVVGCDQVIGRESSPTLDGYRQILSVVSVPPAYIPQVVRVHGEGWPYWEKAGIAVLANRAAVSVSVPVGWRRRAAITWGNGKPAVSSVRFSPCPSPPNVWNGYAGGFFLRSRGACVPLVFQVGQNGIDRHCQ
jgi:hypothetical protein